MTDYDNPWKDVLEHFFRQFLSFFFPEAHAAIDWSRNYESLDKELQQIVSESELGLRLADKLFKVWLMDGQEAWILIHIEIQNQRDPRFAERMFVYNYRIYDRYRQPVISLAVLGDEEPTWRPDRFTYGMFGCTTGIHFPIVKLFRLWEPGRTTRNGSEPVCRRRAGPPENSGNPLRSGWPPGLEIPLDQKPVRP